MLLGEGKVSGSLSHWFEWHIVKQKCIGLVCEKLTIFLYGQCIWKCLFVGFLMIYIHWVTSLFGLVRG